MDFCVQTKNIILLKCIFIICLTKYLPIHIAYSDIFLNEEQKIQTALQHAQQKCDNDQKIIIEALQTALHFISEKRSSTIKIKEYQNIINNFSYISLQLREEYNNIPKNSTKINHTLSIYELKQKIVQINNQLTDLSEQLKQEQNYMQSINKSLLSLPQQQTETKNALYILEQQQILPPINNSIIPSEQAKLTALQTEHAAKKLKVVELELAQLSANNRKELSRLRIDLLKKKYNYTNDQLQIIKNQLNNLCQKKSQKTIEYTDKILLEQSSILPQCIKQQLKINRDLSIALTQQTNNINEIVLKKQEIVSNILQVHQTLNNLLEQARWVAKSPILGETLRTQVTQLPKIPLKPQRLDHEMAKLRAKRLQYENQINELTSILRKSKQDNGKSLTLSQKHVLETQLITQRNLINALLTNYDTQILELTKLKITYDQLKDALQDIKKATHRYLFWVADVQAITMLYPLNIYQDLCKLFHKIYNMLHYIIHKQHLCFQNFKILIIITFLTVILIKLNINIHYYYYNFLKQSSKLIGQVYLDKFILTFHNIWSSALIALPIPILWKIIAYILSHTWTYPTITTIIGDSMQTTTFILWIFIVSAYFASPEGLFIIHFRWSKKRVNQVFSRFYPYSASIIILLITTLIVFNNYNNREFYNTLGRLCFIILCIYLSYITNNLKRSKLPLYFNKYNSYNNIINNTLWNIMLCAPIIAAIFSAIGYLSTAQALLSKLEISFFIWVLILIIYHIVNRWISIQQQHITFDCTKQKQTKKITINTQNKSNIPKPLITTPQQQNITNNTKHLDLNSISTQSLQLIRSILTLIALLFMTFIWSELHSAFSFLENITLWDVTSTIKGVDNIQPITLNACLIAIVVIIITTIAVRNLPAFLELTLLQHLNLTPGTGYAIITLTKYILTLLGSLIGFSLIGIEWAKIQWLVAALGVGLGFGLQEIFANLISGLIILFEKPIRIGDTITICNLTGVVTHINTRATIIMDWDHKEIIIPNKEFITKQFINWSLSDTITRVVLRIPGPSKIDTKQMINILLQIVKQSSLALQTPTPEVFLINLQLGVPIFEIRMYTESTKLRIPLLHQIHTLIIEYYKQHGLELPNIPICLYTDTSLTNNNYFNIIKTH